VELSQAGRTARAAAEDDESQQPVESIARLALQPEVLEQEATGNERAAGVADGVGLRGWLDKLRVGLQVRG
jgi:hypothetical protein